MPKVAFTAALSRFLPVPAVAVEADSVRAALDRVFAEHQRLRGYVLDDQGALRRHVVIYINGRPVADRSGLSDAVGPADEIYVFQALSGG